MRKIQHWLVEHWYWPVILIASVLIILPQLKSGGYIAGVDSYLHDNEIYEDAMQIKTHQFSYFISLFGFSHSARIVSAVYAPLLNYILGGLLLICGTWYHFQVFVEIATLTLAGLSIHLVLHELHVEERFAVPLSLAYMWTPPLLSWIGEQAFTGLGQILLPLALYVGVKISRDRRVRVIPLALVVTLVVQIHFMNALMAILMLAGFIGCTFFTTSDKLTYAKHLLYSILLVIVLNGNIVGGLIEVFGGNHIEPPFPSFTMQSRGYKLGSGFALTRTDTGVTLLCSAVLIVAAVCWHAMHATGRIMLVQAFLALCLSTAYFPWTDLIHACPRIASTLQFPFRFMPVFWTCIFALAGVILQYYDETLKHGWVLIALPYILLTSFYINENSYLQWLPKVFFQPQIVRYWKDTDYADESKSSLRKAYNSHDLGLQVANIKKVVPDYTPMHKSEPVTNYYKEPSYKDVSKDLIKNYPKYHEVAEPHKLIISWNSSKAEHRTLPVVMYRHTRLVMNGRSIQPKQTFINSPKVKSRIGQNTATVSYQAGWQFKLLTTVMIVSWLILGFYAFSYTRLYEIIYKKL